MTANPWILALHVLLLIVWLGQILYTSRLLGFHVSKGLEALSPMERRTWLSVGLPGMLGVLITGLLMLHGVGTGMAPGDALGYYLKPKTPDGAASLWYVTFHVKLVSFTLLALTDVWLGAQIFRLARGKPPARAWPLAVLMALIGALVLHVVSWLVLAELGVGPARAIAFAFAIAGIAAGVAGGLKLGKHDTRAKFAAVHGMAAALIMLLVALVVAKPLAFGGSTLG